MAKHGPETYQTGPVCLGDLIAERKLLWGYCTTCGRERDLDPGTIPLPRDYPVPDAGKRMKCTYCGSKKIDTRPELYPGGIVAMRERWGGKAECESA
jgi:DNA-directed RNA polymerase subunit RPC12/RpoP